MIIKRTTLLITLLASLASASLNGQVQYAEDWDYVPHSDTAGWVAYAFPPPHLGGVGTAGTVAGGNPGGALELEADFTNATTGWYAGYIELRDLTLSTSDLSRVRLSFDSYASEVALIKGSLVNEPGNASPALKYFWHPTAANTWESHNVTLDQLSPLANRVGFDPSMPFRFSIQYRGADKDAGNILRLDNFKLEVIDEPSSTLSIKAENDINDGFVPTHVAVYVDDIFHGTVTFGRFDDSLEVKSIPIIANPSKIRLENLKDYFDPSQPRTDGKGLQFNMDWIEVDGVRIQGECPDRYGVTRGNASWTPIVMKNYKGTGDTFVRLETNHRFVEYDVADTTGPTMDCPADTIFECDGQGNVAQIQAWLDSVDACDKSGVASITHDYVGLGNGGAEGSALVTFTAIDIHGHSSTCQASVSVVDTTAPLLACPTDAIFECDGLGNAADIDAWLASATAGDGCGTAVVTHDYTGVVGGCAATGTLVTFTATDAQGLTSSCQATVTVVDTTAPEIGCGFELIKGNHKSATFYVRISATDSCGGVVSAGVLSCGDESISVADGDIVRIKQSKKGCSIKVRSQSESGSSSSRGAGSGGAGKSGSSKGGGSPSKNWKYEVKGLGATLEVTAVDLCGNAATCFSVAELPEKPGSSSSSSGSSGSGSSKRGSSKGGSSKRR